MPPIYFSHSLLIDNTLILIFQSNSPKDFGTEFSRKIPHFPFPNTIEPSKTHSTIEQHSPKNPPKNGPKSKIQKRNRPQNHQHTTTTNETTDNRLQRPVALQHRGYKTQNTTIEQQWPADQQTARTRPTPTNTFFIHTKEKKGGKTRSKCARSPRPPRCCCWACSWARRTPRKCHNAKVRLFMGFWKILRSLLFSEVRGGCFEGFCAVFSFVFRLGSTVWGRENWHTFFCANLISALDNRCKTYVACTVQWGCDFVNFEYLNFSIREYLKNSIIIIRQHFIICILDSVLTYMYIIFFEKSLINHEFDLNRYKLKITCILSI